MAQSIQDEVIERAQRNNPQGQNYKFGTLDWKDQNQPISPATSLSQSVMIHPHDDDMIIWLKSDYGIEINNQGFITKWDDYSIAGNNCDPALFGSAILSETIGEKSFPFIFAATSANNIPYDGTLYTTVTGLNRVSNSDNILTMITVFRTPTSSEGVEYSPITFTNPDTGGAYGKWRGIGCDDFNYGPYFGIPGWSLAIQGPGMYVAPLSTFEPYTWNSLMFVVDEIAREVTVYTNGMQLLSTFTMNTNVDIKDIAGPRARITGGRYWDQDNEGFAVAEVIALKRKLISREINGLREYLNTKYGI